MKDNFLYIMHVPWDWIKQRPHFIAENLSAHYNFKVFYPKSILKNSQLQKNEKPFFVSSFITIPLQRLQTVYLYRWISDFFIYLQIRSVVKKTKYIWISHPFYFRILEKRLTSSQILIFDCMDDFLEFPQIKKNPKFSKLYFEAEKNLLSYADYVIASSRYLKEKLQSRYQFFKEIHVINNALPNSFINSENKLLKIDYPEKNGYIDLLYIGTISHWFNFDLILKCLDYFKNLRCILIGPSEIPIPDHKSIIPLGPKFHNELTSYMQKADVLIMPFIVNDLIKSVNPVKLYEYINSGKPVITCNYSEIDQFKDFVFKYDNDNQLIDIIYKLINNGLTVNSTEERMKFLHKNTWNVRTKEIIKILK